MATRTETIKGYTFLLIFMIVILLLVDFIVYFASGQELVSLLFSAQDSGSPDDGPVLSIFIYLFPYLMILTILAPVFVIVSLFYNSLKKYWKSLGKKN